MTDEEKGLLAWGLIMFFIGIVPFVVTVLFCLITGK